MIAEIAREEAGIHNAHVKKTISAIVSWLPTYIQKSQFCAG